MLDLDQMRMKRRIAPWLGSSPRATGKKVINEQMTPNVTEIVLICP